MKKVSSKALQFQSRIAKEYMLRIGFGTQPLLVYRHSARDTAARSPVSVRKRSVFSEVGLCASGSLASAPSERVLKLIH